MGVLGLGFFFSQLLATFRNSTIVRGNIISFHQGTKETEGTEIIRATVFPWTVIPKYAKNSECQKMQTQQTEC